MHFLGGLPTPMGRKLVSRFQNMDAQFAVRKPLNLRENFSGREPVLRRADGAVFLMVFPDLPVGLLQVRHLSLFG